jgi:hypothetical protein
MNRMDALWVGLKLLGVYLLANGAVGASVALSELTWPGLTAISSISTGLAYRELFRGAGPAAVGLILILGAGLFVQMSGERRSVSSPPPDAHP